MEKIIKKYYLETGSKLVNHIVGTNGVDCWFDADGIIQHRCLTVKDFNSLRSLTTQEYNEYLDKYNANYKEPRKSFFEHGVSMESVLSTWYGIGLNTNAYHKDNSYITELLDEDGNVVGHYRAVPGGIHWEYPNLIMQLKKYEEERELV